MIARVNRLTYLVILLMEKLNVQISYSSLKIMKLKKKKKSHCTCNAHLYLPKISKKEKKKSQWSRRPNPPSVKKFVNKLGWADSESSYFSALGFHTTFGFTVNVVGFGYVWGSSFSLFIYPIYKHHRRLLLLFF